ncbi:MAG: NPCBM/NEW2 domain-containing protein [Phycisphaerae bacterium]|nr:NPCBM/NEW2 domain-containing protein [Phycisphaerae bacterium]
MSRNGHSRTGWAPPEALAAVMVLAVTPAVCMAETTTRAADAQPVRVTLQTVTEDSQDGEIVAFSLDRGVRFRPTGGAEIRLIPSQDIIQITIAELPAPLAEQGLVFELANGDRLSGQVLAFKNDRVQVETSSLGPVQVPLGAVLRLSARRSDEPAPGAAESLSAAHREDDIVLLNNGDTAAGLIAVIDAEGIVLETPGGENRIPLDRVAVAVLVPDPTPPGHGPVALLTLRDGTRLTAGAAQWQGASDTRGTLDVSLWDSRVAVPFDEVRQIEIRGGRWTWLSQLVPSDYVHTPMLSLAWPWRADRNVLGKPLRVAGRTFEHGLGVHSECTLQYALDGEYESFVTCFGLDDDSGPYAAVDVEIRVDGRTRLERKGIGPGPLHGPTRIDLKGAQALELFVGFGANGAIQDRFDWIKSGLVRTPDSSANPTPR